MTRNQLGNLVQMSKMGNEEDEGPLEAEIPRVRMNPKNPTSREKQEHEDSGHAVYKNWCAACVEGPGVGGQHRSCRQEHITRYFSHAHCTSDCVRAHCMAQDEPRLKSVSVRVSFHLHAIHDVTCLSVRWSFFVSLSLLFLSDFYLFHTLLVLGPALHLQCRYRRGFKPLHSRRMRSIAPRRFSILSQVMSPSSSTTSTTQRLLQ